MKITIEAEPREIAALVLELQERRDTILIQNKEDLNNTAYESDGLACYAVES